MVNLSPDLDLVSEFDGWTGNPIFKLDLETPASMTASQFAANLINAAIDYKENLEYSLPDPITGEMAPGHYNSNSYVSGVLKAATGRYYGEVLAAVQEAGYLAPGFNNPMPIY